MTQRSRSRSAGSIDGNIQPSNAIPSLPSWVPSRFYTSYALVGAVTTAVADAACYAIPILVPNDVIVTSIGLEVTSAGTAGALMRLAIYDSSTITYLPNDLLVDSGTLAGDAVAYASAVTNLYLRPGHYWAAACYYTSATYPTVRALTQAAHHISFPTATVAVPSAVYNPVLRIGTNTPPSWAQGGFPRKLFLVSGDGSDTVLLTVTGSNKIPRILLGV